MGTHTYIHMNTSAHVEYGYRRYLYIQSALAASLHIIIIIVVYICTAVELDHVTSRRRGMAGVGEDPSTNDKHKRVSLHAHKHIIRNTHHRTIHNENNRLT